LAAVRTSGPNDHALVCLLGMLGLRVSEACETNIADIRYESWYEPLRSSAKARSLPTSRCRSRCCELYGKLPTAVARGRSFGPGRDGGWIEPEPAARSPGSRTPLASQGRSARAVCAARSARPAGRRHRHPRHAVRDAQRTAMRYDMARANLDRHAAHAVAAYLAGMSTG
jgi:integrase/recombinase XerD